MFQYFKGLATYYQVIKHVLWGILLIFSINVKTAYAQTVLTVSINPKIPAQYDDIFTALNAANDGDILYVHPAKENYDGEDSLVITKPITIIGGGYYNDRNTYGGEETKFNKIRIKASASDVKIANILTTRITVEGEESTTINNISLEYIYSDRIDFEAVNNTFKSTELKIINSITPLIFFNYWQDIDESANINIENNILGQVANGGGVNLLIRNNIFNPAIYGKIALANVYNATIANNIFWGNSQENAIGTSTSDFCIFDRNLSYQTSDNFNGGVDNVFGSNNFQNKNPSFNAAKSSWEELSTIVSSDFTLKDGSPAIGSGTEGTDIGITGGEYPFSTLIRYGHPHVQSINVNNPVLGVDDTLKFTIKGIFPTQN
ncbi:hypothetical protein [Chondrinema litorale]|uniref:hypothetical protein n=1 Tax=Chondrinema litorale TaxID=2994555 RepID=UPI0025433142|nr:hypothetical protein [Chondrinema litorale]UZR93778.1 hypothetical protein OQ292_18175 [Chondrinema litorale]